MTRYTPYVHEQCILSALRAPNFGYDIDSMLINPETRGTITSQVCLLGSPGEGVDKLSSSSRPALLHGPDWAEDGYRNSVGTWDVVARFGEIGKKSTVPETKVNVLEYDGRKSTRKSSSLRWTQTPSDILAAVAHAALSSASSQTPLIPRSKIADLVAKLDPIPSSRRKDSGSGNLTYVPVRVLDALTEQVVVARVPVEAATLRVYEHLGTNYETYLNEDVGNRPWYPIELEYSLNPAVAFPTGNITDEIILSNAGTDKKVIKVSIVNADQMVVLVYAKFLNIVGRTRGNDDGVLTMEMPKILDSIPELHSTLEAIRAETISRWPALLDSEPNLLSPLICLVGNMPYYGYDTVEGKYICGCQSDLSVRALSSTEPRKFDEWLSEAALRALAISLGIKGSVAYDAWVDSSDRGACWGGGKADHYLDIERVHLSAGHPSGIDDAEAIFENTEHGRRAVKLILLKAPRELMRGQVFVQSSFEDDGSELEGRESELVSEGGQCITTN